MPHTAGLMDCLFGVGQVTKPYAEGINIAFAELQLLMSILGEDSDYIICLLRNKYFFDEIPTNFWNLRKMSLGGEALESKGIWTPRLLPVF